MNFIVDKKGNYILQTRYAIYIFTGTTACWVGNKWIHVFPKGCCPKRNANSIVHNFNSALLLFHSYHHLSLEVSAPHWNQKNSELILQIIYWVVSSILGRWLSLFKPLRSLMVGKLISKINYTWRLFIDSTSPEEVTQGHFFYKIGLSVPTPKLVATPRLKNPVFSTVYS